MDATIQELDERREGSKCAAYERDALQTKLQRGQREHEKCADAVNCVKGGVGYLRELVKQESADLQKYIEEHWMEML